MTQSGVPTSDASQTHRSILGLRVSALVETVLFLAIALLADAGLGAGDRFSEISPHPFWIIVLLVSTYYGTNEGLATAALCALAALAGHIPEQGFNEERTAWLLRVTTDPVLWIMAALLLGEIRSGHRHRYEALKGKFENAKRQVSAITQAYEMLSDVKSTLEVRVAAQVQTLSSVYRASRLIEREGTDDVLAGIPDLVRTIMAPEKFSLFLLDGSALSVSASEGWHASDGYLRDFDASSPLFQAIVARQQTLLISDPSHEKALAGQGILAAPLVDAGTGAIFGMLKIERIGLTGLNPSSVQNFRTLCEWIGAAYASAQRIEALTALRDSDPMQQLLPGSFYDTQRSDLTALAREASFDACAFYASFEPEAGTAVPDEALVAQSVLRAAHDVLSPNNLRFNFGKAGWTYAVLMPGHEPHMADDVAKRFIRRVSAILAESGYPVRSRHLVEILHRTRRESSLRSETLLDVQKSIDAQQEA
jgi:polysaccharide biosynthesis protein PelD